MSTDKRVRDYCLRTNIDLILIGIIVAGYSYHVDAEAVDHNTTSTAENHEESQAEMAEHAVFFPWFAQILGIAVYYLLSRYARAIPFTAMMFLIGMAIGAAVELGPEDARGVAAESAAIWMGIPAELLLLIFLPGLLYVDAYGIDVHLFLKSFSQLFVFAFPMVLAGTALTALVAKWIFPEWPFDLCMTFGAILSATDPVAVAVLMNELGAPPRLRMHISGESLLNDGSAYVFFNIFRARFLYELAIPGVGEKIGWGLGFKKFFQLSLGGMCIGIAFGIGTVLVLFLLKHRLSGEDSVTQVVLTISMAYLTYFSSEVSGCSGIIGVLFLGLTVKAFGENLVNNAHLMKHFWEITEVLLNTLLFTLAGSVFGGMLVDSDKDSEGNERIFEPQDWGYLFLLFIFVMAIRFFLVFACYPLISNIGIGTDWREALFMSYSGLRGAVGLALALSLFSEVHEITSDSDSKYTDYTEKVFFFTGGIAMLTLCINAPTCGPVLKRLGLVTPTETRLKIISKYRLQMTQHSLTEYVSLLADERFYDLDFTVVRAHCPFLRDVTYEQLKAAVKRHQEKTPPHSYSHPHLANVLPYVISGPALDENSEAKERKSKKSRDSISGNRRQRISLSRFPILPSTRPSLRDSARGSVWDLRSSSVEIKMEANEERLIFIKALRSAYHYLIGKGEVESRGFLPYSLFKSLDYAQDKAARGQPLSDWDALCAASNSLASRVNMILLRVKRIFRLSKITVKKFHAELEHFGMLFLVQELLTFIKAHEIAEKAFKDLSQGDGNDELSQAENIVLQESVNQVLLAEQALEKFDAKEVQQIKSHYACNIILNRAAAYYERLSRQGLMSEREAGELIEEIEANILHTKECLDTSHTGELSDRHKMEKMPEDDWSLFHLRNSSVKSATENTKEEADEV
mmetsp:Transcript_14784/g.20973  ORF Transcript_14784/g.20973 Transcript_14784/m.20973 type:complete len:914 (+) Transcript_14784:196-2937(+)|eukprot:CAMPEP_0201712780 /NCGR_PEP_ID=MMETSP0578-20130828/59816_1 /ASSEMBLY_ACC=CAM_ASM_000663 /TAXON_ID=267565 /ORGANISM="Skeletonema grethea, Strain CCMP 1804" /LENGTH=913 /DNA_ID=CAMNT_0048201843 /DNA_START=160 /DNA_END=2901 /DNA_ORIENTATION=+